MGLGKKAKARAKIVKGKTKKHAGKATGNNRLRAKGKAGEVTGKLKLRLEKIKDSAKH
ncbi:MAG: CsbD family protein [Trebonia sp.]